MKITFNKKEVAKMSKKSFLKKFGKYKRFINLETYYNNVTAKKSVKINSK